MSKLKYELDEGLSSEEAKIQQLVLDQLEKEDEKRTAKDNADLTDEGALIWIAIKKRYSLEWDGKYCLPTTGTLEEKAQKLENLLRNMDRDDDSQLSGQDRRVVWERLERSEKWCRNPPELNADPKRPQEQYRKLLFDLVLEDWKSRKWDHGLASRIRERIEDIHEDQDDPYHILIRSTDPVLEFRKKIGRAHV